MQETNLFVIYKSDKKYSITECSSFGVKQAIMTEGTVSGDGGVLLRLSRFVPVNETLNGFVERMAGNLIYDDTKILTTAICRVHHERELHAKVS